MSHPTDKQSSVPLTIKLPDEVIEHTRQLILSSDGHQWVIGDHLVAVVDEFGHMIPRHEIIRQLSGAVGADPSTLRDREIMARFFDRGVRAEYDMLTYSQLRACKSSGERWREYADWAAANLPAPVALIRARVKHNGHLPPAWVSRWERVLSIAALIAADEDAPPVVRLAARLLGVWG